VAFNRARIREKSQKGQEIERGILLPNQQHEKGWMLAAVPPASSLSRINDFLKVTSPVQS